jgi:two-component system nitrogen regulation response regulator GlnG
LKHLCALDFSGNVRQLENLCHWLTVMAPGQLVELADLPPELREALPAVPPTIGKTRWRRKSTAC